MAKRKVKKALGAGAPVAAAAAAGAGPGAQDRCNSGDEIKGPVLVVAGVNPEVGVEICGSPASLVIIVDDVTIYDQGIVDSFRGHVPAPAVGESSLVLVSLVPTAEPWRIQTEVSVKGAVGFRHRKTDASKLPHPKFAVVLKGVA